jgi:hypothetical protein
MARNLKAPARKLIQKMIDHVLANPKSLYQESYPKTYTEEAAPVCDPSFCAAGHLVLLKSKKLFKKVVQGQINESVKRDSLGYHYADWSLEAVKVLGLKSAGDKYSYHGYAQLFGLPDINWPKAYRLKYEKAKGPKSRAKVFAALWTKFIEVDGDVTKLGEAF